MPNHSAADIALQHYGGWQQLLDRIDKKVDFYTRIEPIFQLMHEGGLHPGNMLDANHPAYFFDAIALRCINTYDPEETDHCALERCMVDQLHHSFELMDCADCAQVEIQGQCYEQYPLDSLQRLAWRLRKGTAEIDIYLQKNADGTLEDGFRLELKDGAAVLTTRIGQRGYEIDPQQTLELFCLRLSECFKLATEERGYFVPPYVWLCVKAADCN